MTDPQINVAGMPEFVALTATAQPASGQHSVPKPTGIAYELELVLSDPDSKLSDEAERAISYTVAALRAQPTASVAPVAWIRKNGFRFNADIEPQDDNEIPLYAAPAQAPDLTHARIAEDLIDRIRELEAKLAALASQPRGDAEYPQAAKVCAELYQVIGSLAADLGVFDHPKVVKALDNSANHALVHDDVLPFPSFEQQPAADKFVATFRCESNGIVGSRNAPIHSVSIHDDGVVEVVIDHWPEQPSVDARDALVEMVHEMFRSGNSVPVERITITRKQYDAAMQRTTAPEGSKQ